MNGIIFFKTQKLDKLKKFYIDQIGCTLWLDQDDCIILKNGNMLFGLHQQAAGADTDTLISFVCDSRTEVDSYYNKLKAHSESAPRLDEKYNIYHFFAADPEERKLEFQHFEDHIENYLDGKQLLLTRRSIRHFTDESIPDSILNKVLNLARFAPTARNMQPYYFKIITDKNILNRLAETRGKNSSPINRSPMAVAIVADPEISKRYIQDGCIAAYHFLLAAWQYGLGTCWIAAMDTDEVKDILGIDHNHYIATITPLGYPQGDIPSCPTRKELDWYLRE
jgi:nitroreductase